MSQIFASMQFGMFIRVAWPSTRCDRADSNMLFARVRVSFSVNWYLTLLQG